MCLHIFSPGKRLELDYVAESITLEKGGSEETIEMLLSNHSGEDIDRIHLVYPRALPNFPDQPEGDQRIFQDLTSTWLDINSPYNRLYRSIGDLRIEHLEVSGFAVTASIRDLHSLAVVHPYRGWIRGHLKLTRYQPAQSLPLNDEEWAVLSRLGWAVITIHFESVIPPTEARWLRVFARGGRRPQNIHSFIEYWYRKLCGLLVDTFKIEGPIDLKERIVAYLRAADQFAPSALDYHMKATLPVVVEKVLTRGIEVANTETVVQDWRINIFWNRYRRIADPVPSGDIVASGPGHTVLLMDRKSVKCYQFKAGMRNKVATSLGRFVINISAEDIPLVVPALGWIGILLAIVGIVLAIISLMRH
jgi:hypothetical protein